LLNYQLLQFSYLQMLDFLSTTAFLAYGIQEGNPLVRLAIVVAPSPLAGLLLVKVLAMMLGVYCWWQGKQRLLSRINLLFAVVIAWNLVALIIGAIQPA